MVRMGAKGTSGKPTEEDIGAAMMAWYAEAIKQYPEGLVTQAQAAKMLGISRMALSRLVGRGYVKAVYFPKPPDIVGVAVGQDDPMWLKIIGWMGDQHSYAFPTACYVSFADVMELWQSGEARNKCRRDWDKIMVSALTWPSPAGFKRSADRMKRIQRGYQKLAEVEREGRNRR